MENRILEQKVIKGYRKYLKEMRKPAFQCAKDSFSNSFRRKAVAKKWREQFILGELDKAGINIKPALTKQARDMETAKTFLKKQRQSLLQFGEERGKRQRHLQSLVGVK